MQRQDVVVSNSRKTQSTSNPTAGYRGVQPYSGASRQLLKGRRSKRVFVCFWPVGTGFAVEEEMTVFTLSLVLCFLCRDETVVFGVLEKSVVSPQCPPMETHVSSVSLWQARCELKGSNFDKVWKATGSHSGLC